MVPEVEARLETLQKGVRKIHIIDDRIGHSLMLETYTTKASARKSSHREPEFNVAARPNLLPQILLIPAPANAFGLAADAKHPL